ncbi:MAG TPA: HEPN domain-containing protein [Alloacidobacterium sp.]|nr:HEPN domain-containing protein [Alloacidobacterium sp.]
MRTDGQLEEGGRAINVTGKEARMLLHWLTWADTDYLAARRLLTDGLLLQGAALANTALEKYLKALLSLHGEKVVRLHDPLVIYKKVKECGSSLELDETFLELLGKSYRMRYPDDIEDGYNLVLSQALLLDALDQSVKSISDRVVVGNLDGAVKSKVQLLVEQRAPQLCSLNTALGSITKDALLSQPSLVFECRFLLGNYMGAEYITERIEDASFGREGFVQKSDRSFQLAYLPK